jgi:succinylglutamic semialdehyde dehydrogenase
MTFSSIDPATGVPIWTGATATLQDVNQAVTSARTAFSTWSRTPVVDRQRILQSYAQSLENHKGELSSAISREVGKPNWEALTEVQTMIGKVDLSIRAFSQRCADFESGPAITRFKPHGVVAVFGPFNFPGHLPNGHIVPAILAGNTVVFKPSEHAPLVAETTANIWKEAGLPDGVLNLVQGGRETGGFLAQHRGLDGLFFTGSSRAGLWLSELFAQTPEKILALELGGNNPLVVWEVADIRAAALMTFQSAFITAGQRCTCARRLILPRGREGDAVLAMLSQLIITTKVGPFTDTPEPYMGPVISAQAANAILASQRALLTSGATELIATRSLRENTGLLSPGMVDVTGIDDRKDSEIFGPLLQVIRAPDFTAALAEANATRFGLAAGLISDNPALYERFRATVRAGIVNWNQQLTGASGAAPFGGVGASGNHRPSAFFAADYCSYPVASIEVRSPKLPTQLPSGISPSFGTDTFV